MVVDIEKSKQDVLHSRSSESLLIERRRKIANLEQLLIDEHLNYKITILKGAPGPEIVRYANEQKVDILVIGKQRIEWITRNGTRKC